MLCFSKIYRQRQRRGEGKEEGSQRPPPKAANPAVPMLATDPVALVHVGKQWTCRIYWEVASNLDVLAIQPEMLNNSYHTHNGVLFNH